MLLSFLSRPFSSCIGNISDDVPSNCSMRLLVLLTAFSVISWSSMSFALAKSDVEGSSSSTLFSLMAYRAVTLPSMGMSESKS